MIISLLSIVALAIALFMGMNIGGNNAAASMGSAYGAKARTKTQAVVLIAIFALLGALINGGEVIKTLGKGIVPGDVITISGAITAISVAGICIFIANIFKVPISTSQATVGAVAGIGIFYGMLNTGLLIKIAIWWIVTPIVAALSSFLIGRYVYPHILIWLTDHESEDTIRKLINILLTLSGCYVAYSAGANNAANAVGPFVGAGLFTFFEGALLGGISIGAGALLLGGRVLDTVGKEITELCAIRAVFVEFISAFIVHIASILGIPISLGEIVTAAIIGIGCAEYGMKATRNNSAVKKIAIMWVVSPLLAGSISMLAISAI
ncbi:MAG: anion permease [Methanosarcinales archaeon]